VEEGLAREFAQVVADVGVVEAGHDEEEAVGHEHAPHLAQRRV
jgi:hypothetical protein